MRFQIVTMFPVARGPGVELVVTGLSWREVHHVSDFLPEVAPAVATPVPAARARPRHKRHGTA
jgi:hypothetical protein